MFPYTVIKLKTVNIRVPIKPEGALFLAVVVGVLAVGMFLDRLTLKRRGFDDVKVFSLSELSSYSEADSKPDS